MREIVCTKRIFKVGNSLAIVISQESRMLDLTEKDLVEVVLRVKDERTEDRHCELP